MKLPISYQKRSNLDENGGDCHKTNVENTQ